MLKKILVLVIDTNYERGKNNVRSFWMNGSEIYLYDGRDKLSFDGNEFNFSSLPAEVDLVILHDNDSRLLSKLKEKYKFMIRYTGGLPPSELEKLDQLWVKKRSITNSYPLSNAEAKSILEWICLSIEGDKRVQFPDIFKTPQNKGRLIALFLLCKGFLVAHGDIRLKHWDKVWDIIPQDFKLENKGLKQLKTVEQTESLDWWSSVFDSNEISKDFQLTKINIEELSSLPEISDQIKTLFIEIKEKALVSENTVYEVYNSLKKSPVLNNQG
jgi:hypothetical protein